MQGEGSGGGSPEFNFQTYYSMRYDAYCVFLPKENGDKKLVESLILNWKAIDFLIGDRVAFAFQFDKSLLASEVVSIEDMMSKYNSKSDITKRSEALSDEFMNIDSIERTRRLFGVIRQDLPAICLIMKVLPEQINIFSLSENATYEDVYDWLKDVVDIIELAEQYKKSDGSVRGVLSSINTDASYLAESRIKQFESIASRIGEKTGYLSTRFTKESGVGELLTGLLGSQEKLPQKLDAIVGLHFPKSLLDPNKETNVRQAIDSLRRELVKYEDKREIILRRIDALKKISDGSGVVDAAGKAKVVIDRISAMSIRRRHARQHKRKLEQRYKSASNVISITSSVANKIAPLIRLYEKLIHNSGLN